jgi:N-acetylmuramoyl-L-alanine amidase
MKVCATPTEIYSKLILIDAGHGGIDGGAVSRRGTIAKHINLSISLKVRDKLKSLGDEVIMTREEITLITEEYQEMIPKSIVKSIEEYFVEGKKELS